MTANRLTLYPLPPEIDELLGACPACEEARREAKRSRNIASVLFVVTWLGLAFHAAFLFLRAGG